MPWWGGTAAGFGVPQRTLHSAVLWPMRVRPRPRGALAAVSAFTLTTQVSISLAANSAFSLGWSLGHSSITAGWVAIDALALISCKALASMGSGFLSSAAGDSKQNSG